MKINIDTKKGADAVSELLQKTIADVQAGAVALSEKTKQDNYQRRMKKYNPLFPDVYQSADFNIPNLIVIVDDAVRRGIDVCEGAIGWLDKKSGMEVLYLYDEAVPLSKLQFVPCAACEAVYFVDNFERNRFVRVDCIFSKAHEERLAELKYIAHSLGAKKCTIEITESRTETSASKKKANLHANAAIRYVYNQDISIEGKSTESGNLHHEVSSNKNTQRSGRVCIRFEGSNSPKRPKLKWFAHDDNIKRLIDMRCKGDNSVQSEILEISGTSYATMSKATACSIDNALSVMKLVEKKDKGNATMEMQVVKENRSKLIFDIEF